MDDNILKIVRAKTKDELVNILLNKEEYKPEIVSAAENELRNRQEANSTTELMPIHVPTKSSRPHDLEFYSELVELRNLISVCPFSHGKTIICYRYCENK